MYKNSAFKKNGIQKKKMNFERTLFVQLTSSRAKYFGTRLKVVSTNFGTRLKVFKGKNTIIRTFDLVPKSVPTTFGTRFKVF